MNRVHFHFSTAETSFSTPALPLVLSSEEQASIKANWQRVNPDGRFFNGAVLTATSIDLTAHPTISISTSDYAHYLYANAHSAATPCRIVYCAAAIVTSDNHLLVGEMNSSTSSPGQLQFAGGNVEVLPDDSISARHCCEREISEEIGDAFLESVELFKPLCIKTGGKADHVGIYYLVRLKVNAQEAEAMFNEHLTQLRLAGEKPELVKAHFVELTRQTATVFCNEYAERFVDYLQPLLVDHMEDLCRR